jgi:uncharacterized membrane protein YdbT with pleckstrin-like domain
MEKRPNFLNRHPWLYVVLAFLVLIAAWGTLIVITMKNQPETIEVTAPQNR